MLQCNPNCLPVRANWAHWAASGGTGFGCKTCCLGSRPWRGNAKRQRQLPNQQPVRRWPPQAAWVGTNDWLEATAPRCWSVCVVGLGRTQCLERRASHCTVRRVRRTAHKLVDDHRRRLCPTESDADSTTSLRERGPHRSNAKKCPHHRRRHRPVSVTVEADTRRVRGERHLKAANHALQLNSQPAGALTVGSPACLPRCTTVSAL